MRYLYTFLFFIVANSVMAQDPTASQLRETAKTQLMQGELDNAIKTLERAKQAAPTDIDVLKELAYATYVKKDYARSMEVGKEAVANSAADVQAFQILGLSYKAIALYKEGDKLYKHALSKFPDDGVLYNEYGELLALDSKTDEAIAMWERGIRADPSYNNNYFNAAMYYVRSRNWLRALLYGEIFVNLESYTVRTEGIKAELYNAWKNLYAPGYIRLLATTRTTSEFEKAVLATLDKSTPLTKESLNAETLGKIRSAFIAEWMQEKDKSFPFQLFKQEQFLVAQGYFDAYNQWLFGDAANSDAYKLWQNLHAKEMAGFKTFQQGRVFKLPAGQYYFGR